MQGVDVRVVYDDIGCMTKLPDNYAKKLKKYGISATPFSPINGVANGEFNNRNHRKILIIDGYIGYTGGVNIADEYANVKKLDGYWKDCGIKLTGNAVWGLTSLFIMDYGINAVEPLNIKYNLYPDTKTFGKGYIIPFGDGPKPLYSKNVGKRAIQNLLNYATRYVYITTPYLVIDNELCAGIEATAMRGVDVRIILPHIPDKKIVFEITRSFYHRLLSAGVKIYEYTPGFIHSKIYLCDDACAIVGSMNLDYRSLVHHFENGVWMYQTESIKQIKLDFEKTLNKSTKIDKSGIPAGFFRRIKRSVVKIFAPLL